MPWNKDGSRKAFYKKSYEKSGFKMKKPSVFKQTDDFEKVAQRRADMNKIIQEDLEKRGYKFSDSKKSASRGNLNIKPRKKIGKKIIKKLGSKIIPGVGWAALGYDAIKEIKSGGAGIKKNIKDVKKFLNRKK
tara:strand:+ start:744 stop:1142 length:399 start_codon:yes stop_codon:yes gene_type:complete